MSASVDAYGRLVAVSQDHPARDRDAARPPPLPQSWRHDLAAVRRRLSARNAAAGAARPGCGIGECLGTLARALGWLAAAAWPAGLGGPPPRGRLRARRHPAWSDRQSGLAAGLRELQPDLIAFQEALKSDDHDQIVELLGPGYHLAHQTGRDAHGSGASIASRWPFEAVHEVDLHVAPRIQGEFPCVTLLAEVAAPEPVGPLLFANHNPNFGLDFEHERELQAVTAARAIQDFVGRRRLHVVVAGDFDTTPDAASGRFWRGRQSLEGTSVCYWDAWESTHPGDPGHTFTPDNPLLSQGTWPQERGRRIDHILVRCVDHGPTLDGVACAPIFDQPVDSVWATDHFGVVAGLAVPTRTPTVIS